MFCGWLNIDIVRPSFDKDHLIPSKILINDDTKLSLLKTSYFSIIWFWTFMPSNQYVSFHVHCTTSWACHPFNRVFMNAKVLFSTINQMFLLMPFLKNMVILRGLFRYMIKIHIRSIWCQQIILEDYIDWESPLC